MWNETLWKIFSSKQKLFDKRTKKKQKEQSKTLLKYLLFPYFDFFEAVFLSEVGNN
jgi:hypothetical protein